MNKLLWMLTGGGNRTDTETGNNNTPDTDTDLASNASKLFEEIWDIVGIVIWILVAILAIVFIVKAVMTALAVMKAADEPQVRQEKIAGFKYLAIGLGIAIVVLSLTNVLVPMIMKFGNADVDKDVSGPNGN